MWTLQDLIDYRCFKEIVKQWDERGDSDLRRSQLGPMLQRLDLVTDIALRVRMVRHHQKKREKKQQEQQQLEQQQLQEQQKQLEQLEPKQLEVETIREAVEEDVTLG